MSETHQTTLLQLIAKAKDGRLSAGQLKEKSAKGSKQAPDAGLSLAQTDHALTALIDLGYVATSGGAKDAPHPRPNASYRLTKEGRDHLRPAKPKFQDTQLEAQESFLLLHLFRAEGHTLTRSEINGKCKSNIVKATVELDAKDAPETIDYQMAMLVEKSYVIEERRGVSVRYTLDPNRGIEAVISAKQHDTVNFAVSGKFLNDLLTAARNLTAASPKVEDSLIELGPIDPPKPSSKRLGPDSIMGFVEQLRAGAFAGKNLVPIHEVRRMAAEHHGAEAASHPAFDPLLMEMQSNEQLEMVAISNNRYATSEQLDDAIPGTNEILFYIVVGRE